MLYLCAVSHSRCHATRLTMIEESCKAMPVAVKRVYEPVSRSDGARVLVDRLWPRGLAKN